MIKVNLGRRKSGGTGSQTGLKGIDLKNLDLATLVNLVRGAGQSAEGKRFTKGPIPKALICIILIWFVGDTIDKYKQEALEAADKEIAAVEKEQKSLLAKLAQYKGYEPKKAQLEADEVAIRTKLDVVSRLLQNRSGPSKMLLQIAQSVPEPVWLTGLNLSDAKIRINGASLGHSFVSEFIKSLSTTGSLSEVSLREIQEGVVPGNDQRVQVFELSAVSKGTN